jgi:hypothetical protein
VHLGVRVRNDPFEAAALNGPDSDGLGYRLSFEGGEPLEACASEIERFCRVVGEPWFLQWRDLQVLANNSASPLSSAGRAALQSALGGHASEAALKLTNHLLGVA